jgi:hypothetical protein
MLDPKTFTLAGESPPPQPEYLDDAEYVIWIVDPWLVMRRPDRKPQVMLTGITPHKGTDDD